MQPQNKIACVTAVEQMFLILLFLHCLHHTVLHEPRLEGAVHALQRHDLAHDLVPDERVELRDHGPRVVHANPDGVPPRGQRRSRPVSRLHLRQLPGALRQRQDDHSIKPLLNIQCSVLPEEPSHGKPA